MKTFNADGSLIPDQLIDQATKIIDRLFLLVKEYSNEHGDISLFDFIEPRLEEISDLNVKNLVQLFLSYAELHEGSDLKELSVKCYSKGEARLEPSDLSLSNGFGTL
ncbi:unnamed protein product [Adineta ricciae]|uniref:Uncharacterized protein n=1 Tax=Adineta ricciae TaxID=249248 RepID=A0A816EYX7_ADIRI|nr:unnamed protein product [Adineta ricciae]CAF1654308.1 unnamed protein product [Adineta ricciae]